MTLSNLAAIADACSNLVAEAPAARVIVEASGCSIIHPDDSGLLYDVWEAIPRPADQFICVIPREMKRVTQGGILVPETTRSDGDTVNYIGRVLAMGPTCFKREAFMVVEADPETGELRRALPAPRCAVGDWVLFRRHQQIRVPVYPSKSRSSEDDVSIRITDDASILAAAPRPDQLKVYVA